MAFGVRTVIDAKGITAELEKALTGVIERNLEVAHAEAKASIVSGIKTGRVYKRGGRSRRASATGEAPASDTGALVASLRTSVKRSKNAIVGYLSTDSKYAFPLEFGSKTRGARPFMKPAMDSIRDTFRAQVVEAVKELK